MLSKQVPYVSEGDIIVMATQISSSPTHVEFFLTGMSFLVHMNLTDNDEASDF